MLYLVNSSFCVCISLCRNAGEGLTLSTFRPTASHSTSNPFLPPLFVQRGPRPRSNLQISPMRCRSPSGSHARILLPVTELAHTQARNVRSRFLILQVVEVFLNAVWGSWYPSRGWRHNRKGMGRHGARQLWYETGSLHCRMLKI